jgi:large subunit ribosomal protein L18e
MRVFYIQKLKISDYSFLEKTNMLSKTKITERLKRKTNSSLAEAIFLAKKNGMIELASALSVPSRKQAAVNLGRLNKIKGDTAIIPGKLLSLGEIDKKLKVYALKFSEKGKEKLKKAGCECKTILEALKKGEKLKGEIII